MTEDDVRKIIREEIVRAMTLLSKELSWHDHYGNECPAVWEALNGILHAGYEKSLKSWNLDVG